MSKNITQTLVTLPFSTVYTFDGQSDHLAEQGFPQVLERYGGCGVGLFKIGGIESIHEGCMEGGLERHS